jgi:hypothetical protein
MKTTRTSCFETNSSSTHSFTITVCHEDKSEKPALISEGVLYPENLKDSPSHVSYGEFSFLTAITIAEKSALFLQHILNAAKHMYDEDHYEAAFEFAKSKLCEKFSHLFTTIDFSFKEGRCSFSSFGEGDDDYIEDDGMLDADNYKENITRFIETVIADDTKRMIESEVPY